MKKGFTLVEILIVVGIISALIAAPFFVYSTLLKRSRDAQRKIDLEQIHLALERYYNRFNTYPDSSNLDLLVQEGFLNDMPTDPREGTSGYTYVYYYYTSTQLYRIEARLESGGKYVVTPKGSYVQ